MLYVIGLGLYDEKDITVRLVCCVALMVQMRRQS